MSVPREHTENLDDVHVVLIGDSTLDNGRYLNIAQGDLSVEKQLTLICMDRGWDMTVLAQDGSMLEDVKERQVPLIPEGATHIVLSASGNDLLSLLNQMVLANFTFSSMYGTIGIGLNEVAERYRELLQQLKSHGCHLAVCTVYRPNFNHLFFKSLASLSLGLHNSRIQKICEDLDCSVIDFANMFDSDEDFANPLELSTRGGSKVVENVAAFVTDNPLSRLSRHRRDQQFLGDDTAYLPDSMTSWGVPMRCCATRSHGRKTYASKAVSKNLLTPDEALARTELAPATAFSQAQEGWRDHTNETLHK